jgi:hypothetical protein
MQVSSVRNTASPLAKTAVRPNEAASIDGPQSGKGEKATTAFPVRPELPAWKAERNAARNLHKSGSTEDWLAARTSWMTTRDAAHASRGVETAAPAARPAV